MEHVGVEEDRPKIPAFLERLKVDRSGKMAKKIVGVGPEIKTELDKTIALEIGKR